MRVTKKARAGKTVKLLQHGGVGVRIIAERPEILAAVEAVSAGDGEWHNHPVATLQRRVSLPYLHHLAHEFMAENVARFHARNRSMQQVEVRSTNRGQVHPNDGVPRILNLRIRYSFHTHVVLAVPAAGFHIGSS